MAVEIIAHRGASRDAPENTSAAFELGWKQGADAVELDVRLTKDGKVVAFHDESTRRIAGVNKRVAQLRLDELREVVPSSWKAAHIPSIDEVLATLPDGRRLFIEIKCGPEALPELERALGKSEKPSPQIAIIGLNFETMRRAREQFPKLAIYWVVAPRTGSFGRAPSPRKLVAKAKAAGFDGLDISVRFAIGKAFVSAVKAAGLKLYVWTVNNAKVASKLAALGVDGITTDRPLWLREQLKQRGSRASLMERRIT